MLNIHVYPNRKLSKISPLIYGQFAEHFHRQIYGGIYDPQSEFADEDGLRMDVIDALKKIHVPIIRWPGGCFVSAYHWKYGVGDERRPVFDKAWRVEEPNLFGTDEFIRFCRKVGCEPYICTNAGTGTMEEMSGWVEYCNLSGQGWYGRLREKNGHPEPYGVRYWSIGNENWGPWEIGANNPKGWAHLVTESAKMMKRTDPSIELSAAALTDMDWNTELLKKCGERLDWISIHGYWDFHEGRNHLADYDTCLAYMKDLDKPVRRVRGLLEALEMDHIRIAYDEWNLRAWYHPNIMDLHQGSTPQEYLTPRDENDRNEQYTMADAVFSACFLNMCIRNSNVVGMANFSPAVNTRGMICTHQGGIVLRSTYYVFELYNRMQDNYIDSWNPGEDDEMLDLAVTADDTSTKLSIAVVNKDPRNSRTVSFTMDRNLADAAMYTVNGPDVNSCNTIDKTEVLIREGSIRQSPDQKTVTATLEPHSVNVITMQLSIHL